MKDLSLPGRSLSRRAFLAVSGLIPAALAAQVPSISLAAEPPASEAVGPKKYPVGLELYSVRGELARNLPATLKTVAGFGYAVVEFY